MNEVNDNLFAKIPTGLFYHVVNNPTKDNNTSSKDNSILTNIRDGKVLLIIYYLYIATNYIQEANISISYLINKCNYYSNDKVKNEFKIILNDLCKLKYISINEDINKLKHNDLFIVNTENIFNSESFVILEQKELNTLILNSTNKKELINLLKVYLYLKCKCYKKKEGDYTAKNGGRAQVAYPSYNNIADYTYTSESHINEYIIKLKELNLIDYKNLGKKYSINDPKKKISDCNNVYTIMSVCSGEIAENELVQGLKQQQHFYEENDYIIVKTNNINDKAIYGRKGYLVRKVNNNTITEKEQIELELLNTDIEQYKIKFKPKKKKEKGK
jgi:hypothetical protein